MGNILILATIFSMSLFLGLVKFATFESKDWKWQRKFAEIWNDFVSFFIAGIVGYYFAVARLPMLLRGESINIGDFLLFVIFMLGIFGHLCVMSKNVTDGIEVILSRVLDRK